MNRGTAASTIPDRPSKSTSAIAQISISLQFSEMSKAIETLQAAQKRAMAGRPKVGGFPYLAETLRRAGVTRNLWYLPSCQSLYLTEQGPLAMQGAPLISGTADVPAFDKDALIKALRTDQVGESTFPSFWRHHGVRESSTTMWISAREPSRTMAAMVRNISSRTRLSKSTSKA
jgi:uncharacterized protein YbcV (DUF1398 family)